MTNEFAKRTKALRKELLELKTAKKMASWSKFYTAEVPAPTGVPEGAKATFTVQFEHDAQADRPIAFFTRASFLNEVYFGAWDSSNETLKLINGYYLAGSPIVIGANRPITSITQD